MSPEQVFSIANVVALLSWIALALFPRRPFIQQQVTGIVVPTLLATVYAALIATQWMGSSGGFSTLGAVAQLFSNPWLLLAGWVHYLCFDLLIGGWEVRDAQSRGVPHLAVVPCLALTFMFGPAGWLAYCGVRALMGVDASTRSAVAPAR